jgi:ABC-type multidrug transport system ATPase subunit
MLVAAHFDLYIADIARLVSEGAITAFGQFKTSSRAPTHFFSLNFHEISVEMVNSAPFIGQIMSLVHIQRRNISSLVSLILLPAILLTLLFILQTLVLSITNSPTYRCGCDPQNSSTCGLLHSTPTQAAFCPVLSPPTWPTLVQVPITDQAPILFHGSNRISQSLSEGLLKKESSLTSSLIAAWTSLNLTLPSSSFTGIDFCSSTLTPSSFSTLLSRSNDTSFMQGITDLTNFLNSAGVYLGTPVVTSPSLLIEPSFIPYMPLFGSGSFDSSASLFSTNSEKRGNVSQPIYLLSPNCALFSLADRQSLSQMGCALVLAINVSINCLTMPVQKMNSRDEINSNLYCGWPGSSGCKSRVQYPSFIFDWQNTTLDPPLLDLTLMVNDSNLARLYLPPDVQRWSSPLNLALSSFQNQLGLTPMTLLGLKSFPVAQSSLTIDLTYILGGIFFLWVFMLPLPSFVHMLTSARSQMQLQRIQGLRIGHHRIACYLIFILLYSIFITLFIMVGIGIGLSFFIYTSPWVLLITCLIWGHTVIALSFWVESFLGFLDSSSAVLLSVCAVIFSGLASNLILLSFIENGPEWAAIVLELIPPFALYRVIYEISAYALRAETTGGGQGMKMNTIQDEGNGTIIAWIILSLEAVLMTGCAIWWREVFTGDGWVAARHPFFFLGLKFREPVIVESQAQDVEASGVREVDDVEEEKNRMIAMLADGLASSPSLLLSSLRKVYPNGKVAVHCLDLCIGSDEAFGLLGPNGSGKTSCLSMIQGLIKPTQGQIYVSGHCTSLHPQCAAMSIGVCPQHDVLWPSLTPREHLYLYGRIKGRSNLELSNEVETLIANIGLSHRHSNLPCSQLSGGMLRRLSVGNALVGKPKLCILDEPSTGLDPENRRLMWSCIESARRNENMSLLLTTHSNEEAERLCDRIAIFVNGKVRAIGRVQELKSRFQSSLLLSLSFHEAIDKERVQALVEARVCERARSYDCDGKTLRYDLSRTTVRHVMRALLDIRKTDKGVQGMTWEVTEANLSSVFLQIVKLASEDSALSSSQL